MPQVYVGPGASKEAEIIGLGLTKLSSRQKDDLERAKRYAMEQSVQYVLRKQQQQHQQNQQKVAMYAQGRFTGFYSAINLYIMNGFSPISHVSCLHRIHQFRHQRGDNQDRYARSILSHH